MAQFSSYEPSFGDGSDLIVKNESNTNRDSWISLSSYEYPNGKRGHKGGQFIVGGKDGF